MPRPMEGPPEPQPGVTITNPVRAEWDGDQWVVLDLDDTRVAMATSQAYAELIVEALNIVGPSDPVRG